MVSLPHCEQFVRVSVFAYDEDCELASNTATRLFLQFLQRLGSFLNCLSWKNDCSPAVNTNSMPQSTHFSTLSWNSMKEVLPFSFLHNAGDPGGNRFTTWAEEVDIPLD